MVLTTLALGAVLSILRELGLPPKYIYNIMPYLTFGVLIYSGYEACRRLLSVYDIRLPGAHHDEQNHRHRR